MKHAQEHQSPDESQHWREQVADLEAKSHDLRAQLDAVGLKRSTHLLESRGTDPERRAEARQALGKLDNEAEELRADLHETDEILAMARARLAEIEGEQAEAGRAQLEREIHSIAQQRRKRAARIDALLNQIATELSAMQQEGNRIVQLTPRRRESHLPLAGLQFRQRSIAAIQAALFDVTAGGLGVPPGGDRTQWHKFTLATQESRVHVPYLQDGDV